MIWFLGALLMVIVMAVVVLRRRRYAGFDRSELRRERRLRGRLRSGQRTSGRDAGSYDNMSAYRDSSDYSGGDGVF